MIYRVSLHNVLYFSKHLGSEKPDSERHTSCSSVGTVKVQYRSNLGDAAFHLKDDCGIEWIKPLDITSGYE